MQRGVARIRRLYLCKAERRLGRHDQDNLTNSRRSAAFCNNRTINPKRTGQGGKEILALAENVHFEVSRLEDIETSVVNDHNNVQIRNEIIPLNRVPMRSSL